MGNSSTLMLSAIVCGVVGWHFGGGLGAIVGMGIVPVLYWILKNE